MVYENQFTVNSHRSVNIGNPLGKYFNLTLRNLCSVEDDGVTAIWCFFDKDKNEVALTGKQLQNIVLAVSHKKENLDLNTIQSVFPEGVVLSGPIPIKDFMESMINLRKEAKRKILKDNLELQKEPNRQAQQFKGF